MTDVKRIRTLNDQFRRHFAPGLGKVITTTGVFFTTMGDDTAQARLTELVKNYNGFDKDNDPHNEHDFGQFTFDGRTMFWKIDYYDPSYEFGAENPADPNQCRRVLTIMLAEEY